MDVFQLLQQDHRHLSSLMIRIKAQFGNTDASLCSTFQDLKRALEYHAEVEELYVYPVFQQSEMTRDTTARALEDHRKIKVLLEALAAMSRVDYRWVQTFNQLYETVDRHMGLEETELFGQSAEVLTVQESEELGTRVEVAKQDLAGEAAAPGKGHPE